MLKYSLPQSALLKKLCIAFAFAIALIGIGTATFSLAVPASGVWAVAFALPTFYSSFYQEKVTCTSASDCWVVGYYYDDHHPTPYGAPIVQSIFEHWNMGRSCRIGDSHHFLPTKLYRDPARKR